LQVQFPGNLQSYNRYSYVHNNPLTFFDPTGWGLAPAAASMDWRTGIPNANKPVAPLPPRAAGVVKTFQALGEAAGATALAAAPDPTLTTKAAAVYVGAHSLDVAQAGLRQIFTGEEVSTVTHDVVKNAAQSVGASPQNAEVAAQVADVAPAAMASASAFMPGVPAAPATSSLEAVSPQAELQTTIPAAISTGDAAATTPTTVGSVIGDAHPDSMIHLTSISENRLANSGGLWAGQSHVRLGDVSSMSIAEYQSDVVGINSGASADAPVTGFVVSAPDAATFEPSIEQGLAGVPEFRNVDPIPPSDYRFHPLPDQK
jgi:hypothetical protein